MNSVTNLYPSDEQQDDLFIDPTEANAPTPLDLLDQAVRDLKREIKKHDTRQATIDGLYAQVELLRSQVAEAAMDGRDVDLQELTRTLRNTNNRIDRLTDVEVNVDTITEKKAAVSAALEAV